MLTFLVVCTLICVVLALVGAGLLVFARSKRAKVGGLVLTIVFSFLTYAAFPSGYFKMQWKQSQAVTIEGNWLVVDNSGGLTLRHWIIEGGVVTDSKMGAGYQFYDQQGNICYVGGDAFVMRISQSLDAFRRDYRALYNVPTDQVALK